jgi:hypothetical protein
MTKSTVPVADDGVIAIRKAHAEIESFARCLWQRFLTPERAAYLEKSCPGDPIWWEEQIIAFNSELENYDLSVKALEIYAS